MPITTSRKKQVAGAAKKRTITKKPAASDVAKQQRVKKIAKSLKSKRPDLNNDESEEETPEVVPKSVMDVFKRNFEQQFGKVEGLPSEDEEEDDEEDKDEDDDDDSEKEENDSDLDIEMDQEYAHYNESEESEEPEDSEDEKPLVVKFNDSSYTMDSLIEDKQQKKLFMSSKTPLQERPPSPKSRRNKSKPDEDEQLNLDNDLALQRLIKESHILAEAGLSGVDISTGITGKARHKTLESRLNDLGVKKSKEGQIPMNMRKGMIAKSQERQATHIKQSREAGIILARPSKKVGEKEKKPVKRERGLKIASVGRETRHGLIISKSEIAKYSGTGKKGRR